MSSVRATTLWTLATVGSVCRSVLGMAKVFGAPPTDPPTDPSPPGPPPPSPKPLPVPPFVPGLCGTTKIPCTDDGACPSGCGKCRCFNANGAGNPPPNCAMSYGGRTESGFCSNDTQSYAPSDQCWEHPCGVCGGPPFPIQPYGAGKKQYLMIGDSVSILTFGPLNETLLNSTDVFPYHIPINGGDTAKGTSCIAEWIGADLNRWDAITYNFGMWNINQNSCNLTKWPTGDYVDPGLQRYVAGLANITATLLQTKAAKNKALFFVNTNPTAWVPECCAMAPPRNGGDGGIGPLQTHSCTQRIDTFNQAAAAMLAPLEVEVIDIYGWSVARCGDPATWGYGCDIIPQINCSSSCGTCSATQQCHDKKASCVGGQCRKCTNCDACQVHPTRFPVDPSKFMSGSDYFSIPIVARIKSALGLV